MKFLSCIFKKNSRKIGVLQDKKIICCIISCVFFIFLCLYPSAVEFFGVLALLCLFCCFFEKCKIKVFFFEKSIISLCSFVLISAIVNLAYLNKSFQVFELLGWIFPFGIAWYYGAQDKQIATRALEFCVQFVAVYAVIAVFIYIFNKFFGFHFSENIENFSWTFRNATRSSLYFSCALILIFFSSMKNMSLKWIFCLFLFIAIVITEKRATLFSVLLCIFIGSAFIARYRKFLGVFLLLPIVIICSGKIQRFDIRPNTVVQTQTFIERKTVWYAAIKLIEKNPFFGSGFGSFKEQSKPYVDAFREVHLKTHNYERLEDAHNLFLHMLSETGIVGTVLFLGIFVFPGYSMWHKRSSDEDALPLTLCLVFFLLNTQLHVNIFSLNVGWLLMLLTGFMSGVEARWRNS